MSVITLAYKIRNENDKHAHQSHLNFANKHCNITSFGSKLFLYFLLYYYIYTLCTIIIHRVEPSFYGLLLTYSHSI